MNEYAMAQESDGPQAWLNKLLYILSSLFLALTIAVLLLCTGQTATQGYVSIGGYSVFRVVTGSMEPTIPTGALLVCHQTDIDDVRVGDIVCYRTKASAIYGAVVTHRVVGRLTDESGQSLLETQGDANLVPDGTYVRASDLVGRVTWYTGEENFLTSILSFIGGKTGFLVCIAMPIMLISGLMLQSAVNSLKQDLRQAQRELASPRTAEEDTPLPGYTTITRRDYEELYAKLREELLGEQYDRARNSRTE